MKGKPFLVLNGVCWLVVLLYMFSGSRDDAQPTKRRQQDSFDTFNVISGNAKASADAQLAKPSNEPRAGEHDHAEHAADVDKARAHVHDGGKNHVDEHVHKVNAGSTIFQDSGEAEINEKDQLGAVGAVGTLRPGERPEVTREAFARRAMNNQLLVTFSNYQHRLFMISFVRNLARLGIDNYIICAFDDKLMDFLIERGVYAVRVRAEEQVKEEGLGWGSKDFIQLMRVKYIVVAQIIKWGFELLVTDADIGYLQNPLPYLYLHSRQADMLITTDNLHTETYDGGLELPTPGKPEFNSGFVYIRPTERAVIFFDKLVANMIADKDLRDQPAINLLMMEGYGGANVVPGTRIFHAWNNKLRVGALPTILFCNGHTFFVQRMPQRFGLLAYTAHVTHVYSGDHGKRTRLREAKLFYDDLSYYADGNFLAMELELPRELMRDQSHVESAKIPTEHVALGKYQLKQFLDGALLAKKLGRILIVPAFVATCDRAWFFMVECRMGGGHNFGLPFVAPMDHMINIWEFERVGIDFREYSFLDNRMVPREVLDSRLNVRMCDYSGGPSCADKDIVRAANELWVAGAQTDAWWLEKLAPYKDTRIIHFSPMSRVLSGMASEKEWREWKDLSQGLPSHWCCYKDGPVPLKPDEYK